MKVWKFIKGVLSLGRVTLTGKRDLPLLTDGRVKKDAPVQPPEIPLRETPVVATRKKYRKDR